MIDEDPGRSAPNYIKNLEEFRNFDLYHFRILYDRRNNNYLFILNPRLEEWILRAITQSHCNIGKYNFSNDPDLFHAEAINRNHKLEELITELKNKSEMIKEFTRQMKEIISMITEI
ncbi:MAG: hypothetical protein ACTSPY_07500 [Candidatus Helarchaeota archaeon]